MQNGIAFCAIVDATESRYLLSHDQSNSVHQPHFSRIDKWLYCILNQFVFGAEGQSRCSMMGECPVHKYAGKDGSQSDKLRVHGF